MTDHVRSITGCHDSFHSFVNIVFIYSNDHTDTHVEGIVHLPVAEAAEALTQAQQARAPAKPSQQDQEIIRHAKALLQSARGMAEPEAHRYLQRRSMEAHRKMADTARLIIAALEK